MKKFAIILSGCGFLDGSEINESVLTMLSLKQCRAEYDFFAPDILVHKPIDYLTKDLLSDQKNVLHESAKIARGHIGNLNILDISNYDGLIIPGGFGAIDNLANIADIIDGKIRLEELSIEESVEKAVLDFYKSKKPILAICIAPLLVALILKSIDINDVKITLGNDSNLANKFNIDHIEKNSDEFYFDEKHSIYTSPAFMASEDLAVIYKGIFNAVKHLVI